ncbi:MAG: hypothetical protein HZB53_09555 [Chloroflexi bacterium]|nr:hypothetical protein [Chloroflexota bacterium]
MQFDSADAVKQAGFVGFKTTRTLQAIGTSEIPEVAGVYVILRDSLQPPRLLPKNKGGWFKGKDPTVPTVFLRDNWIDQTVVLYIGQAGGGTSANTLRKRVRSYMKFGEGEAASHWGGRLIWQLEDSNPLLVSWKPTGSADARQVERRLLEEFKLIYGKLPFANRQQ